MKTELRIGNWVNKSNLDMSVIKDYQIGAHDLYQWDNSHYYCIHLTEEWLVKFGFKKTWVRGVGVFKYELEGFTIAESRNEVISYMLFHGLPNDYNRCNEIYYVHQLQNLYFALTGKELTSGSNTDSDK